MTFRNIFLLIIFVVLFNRDVIHAQEFQCSGTLIRQVFGPGESNRTNHFEVTVSGNRVLTLTSNLNSGICRQVAIDDRVIYTFSSYPNGNTATVKPGDFPEPDGSSAVILWLALSSSSYFQQVKTNQLRPVWMLDDPHLAQEGFTVKADWEMSGQTPNLPQRITYFNDGIYRTEMNGVRRTSSAPAPFDKGYTNAIYEVFSVTNQSGLEIPTNFKFTRFYIWNRQELRPREITRVKVAYFNKSDEAKLSSAILRFRNSDPDDEGDRGNPMAGFGKGELVPVAQPVAKCGGKSKLSGHGLRHFSNRRKPLVAFQKVQVC